METKAIGAAGPGAGAPPIPRARFASATAIVFPEQRRGGAAARPGTNPDGPAPTWGAGEADGAATGLGRGDTVDRYVILARLAEGGMGVVFAAYDPELDRKVALKLLRPTGRAAGDGEARARQLREAQALAQLQHPAVVAIHDVGTVGGRVWLAMEFVEGVTLARWLERPRAWREVLEVFRRAGEGLAAAHAAGLVHRDFTPDNVMVGAGGRVRVMDFGLARVDAPAGGDAPAAPRDGVTDAGALPGTPAYMAPEQWHGGEVDARSDQFAFCVALWEALYGQRPFAGDAYAGLAQAVAAGRMRAAPAGAAAPSWLRRVVERGLASAPARRWPTMDALLAALASGAGRRRRRLWVMATAAAIGALCAGWVGRRWDAAEQVAACERRGGTIAEVWNTATRGETREALAATGVPFAATTIDRLIPRLDEFAAGWAAARTEACMQADVAGTWDPELATRADECLAEARWALEDLVAALVAADAGVVTRAVTAAAGLPPVAPCLDAQWLARRPRPPADGPARDEAAALLRALEQVDTLLALGRYAEGVVRARQLVARADALGWSPLAARVRVAAGRLAERAGERQEAERLLEDGFYLAVSAGEEVVAVEAAAMLAYTVGDRLGRTADGLRWGRLGRSLVPRLGPASRAVEVDLYDQIGNVESLRGDYAAAEALYREALARAEALYGPTHPDVAVVLNNLAAVHYGRGDYDAAGALYARAMALYEAVLGPDHPHMAAFANNLGSVHLERGSPDAAEPLLRRALAIRERALGPEHADVAMPLANLAAVHFARGEVEPARRMLARALAIYERAFGREHVEVAATLDTLGQVEAARGDVGEARRLHARALAIREELLGPDHLEVADSLRRLADVTQDAPAAAEALYRRALAIDERGLPADHTEIAEVRRGLAEALLAQGRAAEATATLEPAMGPRPHDEPLRLARARFTLARALWAGDGDRARARRLADEAATAFRANAAREAEGLAAIEAWLAAHPASGEPAPAG